ncbi:hypothetical protein BpHYR1_040463 [Brachionus plicatilis]|uniref:Uncharacterized protein n=1 Tax=Brachionus plicatilis TaxID=10195 RepID=A0A3M7REC6_BRAPC|nr:hypothetical protein BpHYR1_040463 [Brachionus plicatilis]
MDLIPFSIFNPVPFTRNLHHKKTHQIYKQLKFLFFNRIWSLDHSIAGFIKLILVNAQKDNKQIPPSLPLHIEIFFLEYYCQKYSPDRYNHRNTQIFGNSYSIKYLRILKLSDVTYRWRLGRKGLTTVYVALYKRMFKSH